jgi:hypothetical protein
MNTEAHQRLINHLVVILLLLIALFYVKENWIPNLQKAFDLNSQVEVSR